MKKIVILWQDIYKLRVGLKMTVCNLNLKILYSASVGCRLLKCAQFVLPLEKTSEILSEIELQSLHDGLE